MSNFNTGWSQQSRILAISSVVGWKDKEGVFQWPALFLVHHSYCQTQESTGAKKLGWQWLPLPLTTRHRPRSLAVHIPTSAKWSKKATLRFPHSWPSHVPCPLFSTGQLSKFPFGRLALSTLDATLLQTVGDMPGQTSDERLPWIDDIVTRTALHLAS